MSALALMEGVSSPALLIQTAGVVGFALVILQLARPTTTWSWLRADLWLVAGGLFLSGVGGPPALHGFALLIAAVLVMRARYSWVLTRRAVWRYLILIIGAGVVAPLVFELVAWGISPVEWWRGLAWSQIIPGGMVIANEGAKRVIEFGDTAFELRWGGWETLLIAGLGIWAMRRRKTNGAEGGELVAWGVLILGLMALPVVFPNESAVADGIVFLASVWAVYRAARHDNDKRGAPVVGTLLPIVTLLWACGSVYLGWSDLPMREEPKQASGEPERAADSHQAEVMPSHEMETPEGLPYLSGLRPVVPFFADGQLDPDARWFAQREGMDKLAAPFEYWRWRPANIRHAKVVLDFSDRDDERTALVAVELLWHRGAKFVTLAKQTDDIKVTSTITLEGDLPEAGGWIGVVARPEISSEAGYQLEDVVWLQ